jgi:RNA polymerase sigma-70 factor (ECF subfamily)
MSDPSSVGPADERRLVLDARSGDAAAWESLYRSIYPRLRAFFIRRVGMEHAEDCTGETMTRAVASIHRFKWGVAGFDGWVFGIARHVAVDHHRRVDRERRYGHAGHFASGDVGEETAPDHNLISSDDEALVRRLFTRLSPAEQEVLELRVIAGLSAEQVGKVLGQRPGTVRTAQSRALAHLRELMAEHNA